MLAQDPALLLTPTEELPPELDSETALAGRGEELRRLRPRAGRQRSAPAAAS